MKKSNHDITIYDLAEELNVSPSTVSRALNDHKGIGKKTKNAVKKLAKERGYRPNNFATSLRTNKSKTIGIMVSWINRPFVSTLISGIEKAAKAAGYHVIITQTYDKLDFEKENLQTLFQSRISALIVSLSMETTNYDHFSLLTNNNIPIVFVDRIPTLKKIHKVQIDNFKAAFEATEHLIQQGCKRIAHFGGSRHQLIFEDRRMGYVAALTKHNYPIDESIIMEAKTLNADEGLRMTETVLSMDHPADGIFCANDTTAISAIRYAKSHGLQIPHDVAIIGFNDDPICEIVEPPLSSVRHPAMAMGEIAVRQALKILNDTVETGITNSLILDTYVIVRASSDKQGFVNGLQPIQNSKKQ